MKFNKKNHTYTKGGEEYISVTTLISKFFTEFKERELARKLSKFPINKQRKHGVRYWLKQWKLMREYGSLIHWLIDDYIKLDTKIDYELGKDEYVTACEWLHNELRKYGEPVVLSEILVYNDDLKIAGTVDCLIEHNGEGIERVYDLIDWKITKAINKEDKYSKELTTLGFPNSNYWKYSLQLNMYAYLLKLEGHKINKLKLVHVLKDKVVVYEIPAMFDKIGEILEKRNEI